MTEEEWVYFAATGFPHVASIGRLEPNLCALLKASTNLVRIRHDYALKLLHKHDLAPHRLPMMEQVLQFGRVIADRRRHLTFFYYDEIVFGGWQQMTVKSADSGTEVWVSTFHPQRPAEVVRLCKKHTIVRPDKA